MKWGGKRGKSFHHGETTPRSFPGLGNSVKRPLSPIFVSSSIPCAEATTSSPFPRAPPAFQGLLPARRQIEQPWIEQLFSRGAKSSSHGSATGVRFTAARRRQRRQAALGEAAWPQETGGACSILASKFTFTSAFDPAAGDFRLRCVGFGSCNESESDHD